MEKFSIPEENLEKLEKKLARIQKKCERYGNTFHYTKVGEHTEDVTTLGIDEETGVRRNITRPVHFIEIEVEGKALVNGWSFEAFLERTSKGNLIQGVGKHEVPARYYSCAPYCEHCKTNRARKYSYIVYNEETQEFKQVGTDCLCDYTHGMSAEGVAWFASALKDIEEASDYSGCGFGYGREYVEPRDYAKYVAETIRLFGYVRSQDSGYPTRCLAKDMMDYDTGRYMRFDKDIRREIERKHDDAVARGFNQDSPENLALVETVFDWILSNENDSNYMHNLKVTCSLEYVGTDKLGLIASIFPTYNRELEYQAEKRERELKQKEEAAASTWAGKVGDRVRFTIAEISTISSWESQWGTTYVFKIKDTEGLTYTWKTSSYISLTHDIGKTWKATIKELKEFRGVKQTEITRATRV